MGKGVEGDARVRGFDAIVEWYKMALAPFFGVPHFMGNHRVLLDGDRARARSYMHVLSMPMGGVYETQVVRTAAGWPIGTLVLDEPRFEEIEERMRCHMAAIDKGSSKGA